MPDATLPRLSDLQNPNRWLDQAFTLRPDKYFPVCLPTDAYALTLIDPCYPCLPVRHWTGFFLAG